MDSLIPNSLLDQVKALAEAEHRSAGDVVREAIEVYLQGHKKAAPSSPEASRPTEAQKRAAWDAGQRIRERRKFHPMPEGETIRSLIDFGRA